MSQDHDNIPDVSFDPTAPDENAQVTEVIEVEKKVAPVLDRLAKFLDGGVLKVNVKRRTLPVELDVGDGSGVRHYTLVQMTGAERGEWMETQANNVLLNKKGEPVGMKKGTIRESDISLISQHLYIGEWKPGVPAKRVDSHYIRGWSSSAIDQLARASEELSCVGMAAARQMREAEDEAKKD